MGRPLPKKFFGDLSISGNQLQVSGILDDSVGIEILFILEQISTRQFKCVSVADNSRVGRIILQQELPTQIGQGRILVTPFGAAGAAQASATLQLNSVLEIVEAGTGYEVGDILTLPGTADTLATLTVDTVDVGGEILTVSISEIGAGYTVINLNPVSVTGGTGTGAEISVDWQVDSLTVVDGGSGYTVAPNVIILGGGGEGAEATAVLTGDEVSSFTVTENGSGYTDFPVVTIQGAEQETVRTLNLHLVKTFEGNIYQYDLNVPADVEGEADVESD